MKALLIALAVAALAGVVFSEDWQCGDPVCTARITEDGELHEVFFRKGDMVSTDAGWSVTSEDGWVRVKLGGPTRPPRLWGNAAVFRVHYLIHRLGVVQGGFSYGVPKAHGSFGVPQLVPLDIALVGL